MGSLADQIAEWATGLQPSADDLALASRSLLDTLAVTLAARRHRVRRLVDGLPEACKWAAIGHVLDFDDLHVGSTAHISVVCTAAALACGGDARAYLAGAGAMARLGSLLGWGHYALGWHATCTAGAPGAAVAASVALGLDASATARAVALAVPAAGGVQASFGTDAKSLQVGFAAAAGVRAARLAEAGATADPAALEQWVALVGVEVIDSFDRFDPSGPAVPGGLAIKLFPCCYAMQRPIWAMRSLLPSRVAPEEIAHVVVRASHATLQPLVHHRPRTGLEAKFSLEYAIAATILDDYPGFDSFTDAAALRPEAAALEARVEIDAVPGGASLLESELGVELAYRDGRIVSTSVLLPPGAPGRPATDEELTAKLAACGTDVPELLSGITWSQAPGLLRRQVGSSAAGPFALVDAETADR